MNSTKKILAGLACAFLPLILLLFGSLMSTYQTLGNPDRVKDALADSGVYSAVVKEGLNHVSQDASTSTDKIPVDRPEVRAVIEQSVPPEYLEQQTNGAIDGFYAWLRGDTQTMQFQVDLTEAKTKLADGLAAYAVQRMETLPACTALDDITADYDPFNATCAPKGNMYKDMVANKVRSDVMGNQEFLGDTVINSQDLRTNNANEVQIGDFKISRDLYNQTRTNMYITGVLAVVLAAAIVLLSRTRRVGVRRLGIIAAVVGGISALLAGFISFMLNEVAQRMAQSADANVLQKSAVDAVRLLTQDIRNWWLVYGLSLLGAGVAALIVLGITRRKQPETEPVAVDSPVEALKTPEPQKPEDKIKYPQD